MFQPETEDMLPRAAPKPSVPIGASEPVPKPSVPEVSIVFGQQNMQPTSTASPPMQFGSNYNQQTYASWKKQVLPKVTYPPQLSSIAPSEGGDSTTTDSNSLPYSTLYPLRVPMPTTCVGNCCTVTSNNAGLSMSNTNPMLFQRNYDSESRNLGSYQHLYKQRRSLDMLPHRSASLPRFMTTEVLTICAGTQTEGSSQAEQESCSLSSNDIEQLMTEMKAMRSEQQRLSHICEMILLNQQQHPSAHSSPTKQIIFKDAESQCDILALNNAHTTAVRRPGTMRSDSALRENIANENAENSPKKNHYNHLKSTAQLQETPKTPMAQSTAYQPNTPRPQRPILAPQHHNIMNILPKPSTEKSMVMNELALKYLPTEKINELMQDIYVTPPRFQAASSPVPLFNIANMEKGPNDLSNASYKYMKKYRLLSEENDPQTKDRDYTKSPLANSPQVHSPFQRIGAGSPQLVSTPPSSTDDLNFDLERIRNQPKFL